MSTRPWFFGDLWGRLPEAERKRLEMLEAHRPGITLPNNQACLAFLAVPVVSLLIALIVFTLPYFINLFTPP